MLDLPKLKALREKLGLTQEEAATRAGLNSRQHWNKIESGRAGSVTLDTLGALARALEVSPAELLAIGDHVTAKKAKPAKAKKGKG